MKELIKDLYKIDVISFIKITDKVYKVIAKDGTYSLKYIDNKNIDLIINKIIVLKIDFIHLPIKNVGGNYVSIYEDVGFILSPWIDECDINDLQLKFFLDSIAKLHNRSFYVIKTNSKFFDETCSYIENHIDDYNSMIEEYMLHIERLEYKSPSQWLFLLNYPFFRETIDLAKQSLERFRVKCEGKTTVRVCLTYNNFDYKNIFIKESKIIGIENIELSPPIYDVFNTFKSLTNNSIDLKEYYKSYFKQFILEDYEIDWLISLLLIPKVKFIKDNEINNLDSIIESLNYLKNSRDIVPIIKRDKENYETS